MNGSVFRKELLDLEPYAPGEQPPVTGKLIKLNTNENPYPPSPKIEKAVQEIFAKGYLRKYPSPNSAKLKQAAAEVYGITEDMVLVTNGSDEGLALLFRAVLGRNSKFIMPYPTYSLYTVLSEIQMNNVTVVKVPLKEDLHFDFERLSAEKGDLLAFAHPNAPTGILEKKEEVRNLIRNFPGAVLSDEAYIDFAEEGASFISEVNSLPNLFVTRTFSKSYSLAGLRVGLIISNPDNISLLMKLKDSYNLGMLEETIASTALKDRAYFKKTVKAVVSSREKMKKALEKLGFTTADSNANFLFTKPPEGITPQELFQYLKAKQIYTRYFTDPLSRNYIRITVGTEEENSVLLSEIEKHLVSLN